MRRVCKSNARETLIKTCDSFHKPTGEVVGIVMTWKGSLTVLGPENFRDLVSTQKDAMWNSLSKQSSRHTQTYAPYREEYMQDLLTKNCSDYTMQTLRRIVSWLTHQSVGMYRVQSIYLSFVLQFIHIFKELNFNLGRFRNFWGHDNLKPTWWPKDIPFVCISNSKKHRITKELLINIVASYQQYNDIKPISKANANLDITTSTPKKRRPRFY